LTGEWLTLKKKIVLLGDSAVGKTSLIRRFVFDQFEDTYISTIGSKVTMKELKIERPGKMVNLTFMIWDLIGREGYHGLHARTFVGVHGAILVADLTRRETLNSLERYWVPFLFKVVEKVPLVFVCNKSDLTGEFEFELDDLSKVAKRYNGNVNNILPSHLISNYSTSAKTADNVEQAFESMGHLVLSSKALGDPLKELFESVVALDVRRSSNLRTPVGALDTIIVDFCDGFDDSRLSMLILRQELARAAFDINNPTKAGIIRAVEFLAEAESEFKDENMVKANLKRRLGWAKKVKEKRSK
jgi:small GTP-binding protein